MSQITEKLIEAPKYAVMNTLADQDCFWNFLASRDNYDFCENQICSIVQQPANTWSNISYLIAAIVIYNSKLAIDKQIKNLFFYSSLFLFFGSTFFHASQTSLGHAADLMGMFLVSMTGLSLAYRRFTLCSIKQANFFFLCGFLFSMWMMFVFDAGRLVFFLQIVAIVLLEFIMRKSAKSINTKRVFTAVGVQSIAFFIWILDVKKIVCDPENHFISGHAVWHLLSGVTIYLFYTAYENINAKLSTQVHIFRPPN